LEQARALRERRAAALDWDNLAEEVEDLAGRHRDALKSSYEVLLEHPIKFAYAPQAMREENWRLWQVHARNARLRIWDLLEEKPGLKSADHAMFAKAWPYARNVALGVLSLDDNSLPGGCPWTLEQARDENFWPAPSKALS
jgi:hypothetical protein